MDSLVQAIRIFSKNIEMEFGIEKCAMLAIEKGKIMQSVGMMIKSLQDGESYKYLRILEADSYIG